MAAATEAEEGVKERAAAARSVQEQATKESQLAKQAWTSHILDTTSL